MDIRLTFNEDVENYDKWRPTYCNELFKSIYQKYRPSNTKLIENDTQRYNNIFNTIQSYGFRDVVFKLYHLTRTFSSTDYIALLNTYSDHSSMPSPTKELFENEIKESIIQFGDVLKVYDTIDLYLARK